MFTTHSRAHRFLHASLLRGLLAAWLVIAPSASAAQDTAPKMDEEIRLIREYLVEGWRREQAGEIDAAIDLYRKALDLSEKKYPGEFSTGMSLESLGVAYLNKGDFNEAERYLTRAVKVLDVYLKMLQGATPGKVPPGFADVVAGIHAKALHGLAVVYDYRADYSRAEPLYGQALALREQVYGPDHVNVAETLNFLGILYLAKADHERAAQTFRRALAINEKYFDPEDSRVTMLLGNLASAYESMGDAAKAEELLREAIARAEKRPNSDSLSKANHLNNLGTLYGLKDPARGRPLLTRALAIREKLLGPGDPLVAATINNLAMLDWREGELKRAEQLFMRALDIHQRASGPAHPDVATTLSNLALLYVAMGDTKRGVRLLSEGSKYSERNLLLKLATGSEEQKRTYLASVEEGTSGMVSLHLRKAPDDEQAARLALNTILWRKGRVLDVMSGQVAATLVGSDAEGRAAVAKLTETRGQLSALVVRGSDGNEAAYKARGEALQAQMQALEKMVSERATAAADVGAGSINVEAVQASIPADGALVEVVQYRPATFRTAESPEWGQPRYAAYVLKRTGAPSAVDLGDAAKIDADVSRLRAALGNRLSQNVRPLARALDEEVMRPVRKLMGDIKRVLISPDGALNLVPYAALVDERDKYLVETYAFTYLASGRDIIPAQGRTHGGQSPVVIADPLFDGPEAEGAAPGPAAESGARGASFVSRFTPLKGTSEEAREVSDILRGARTLTGAQATEAALKQVKAPSILHIATHGFFYSRVAERSPAAGAGGARSPASGSRVRMAENPLLRSGLALTGANRLDGGQGEDGILTALEAAALDLHGTQLIVLSACETGVGEVRSGEGVYGLRRALALAGAESQLISLWKVNDEATRDLMAGFYQKLTAGEGRSEALRQVQLKLLRTGEYSHPYFWAGFIMSGQSGPLG